jgi:mRNA-degrading endonuclease toxin of MazEF toxin-antitoxin module
MKIYQGDILEVNVYLPDGGFKPHPAIVISNNNVNSIENSAIVVMISSTSVNDEFSYHLSENMMTVIPKKKSQVRCQLINLITESDIISKHGKIKSNYLHEIINQIIKVVFNP